MASVRKLSRRSLLASMLPAARALHAQQNTTFTTDVKVVNVLATVRDKKGQIISSLKQDDFRLEDESRPQTIRYFAVETNLALTLGLLIDTSGSQRRVLPEERVASYRFLEDVLREDKDQAFVIHFDHEAELLQDLTSSRKRLEASLRNLEVPRQGGQRRSSGGPGGPGPGGSAGRRAAGTVLYDAVLLASDELMKKQAGRKALIVLSDGVDNGSKVSIHQAIEAAQRADTMVYSILFADQQAYGMRPPGGYGGRGRRGGPMPMPMPNHPDGKKVLQQMSKETGGGFFEVSNKHSLDQVYARIQEELRNQYNIGFSPDPPPQPGGAFRKISLTTTQKGLIVQARQGYYPVANLR
jgi:VWFA-related protein